jgi:hypothetical protein
MLLPEAAAPPDQDSDENHPPTHEAVYSDNLTRMRSAIRGGGQASVREITLDITNEFVIAARGLFKFTINHGGVPSI